MNSLSIFFLLCVIVIKVNGQWGYPSYRAFPILDPYMGSFSESFPIIAPAPYAIRSRKMSRRFGGMAYPMGYPMMPYGGMGVDIPHRKTSRKSRDNFDSRTFDTSSFDLPMASHQRFVLMPIPAGPMGPMGPYGPPMMPMPRMKTSYKQYKETSSGDQAEADQILQESKMSTISSRGRGPRIGSYQGKMGKFSLGNPFKVFT